MHRRNRSLYVFQANVAHGQSHHDIALSMAYEEGADVILIQEPWIHSQQEKRRTKTHPAYSIFSPNDDWNTRPRVLTYINKGRNLRPTQLRPSLSADICWVQIHCQQIVTLVNVYRPPRETASGEVIRTLLQYKPPANCLIAGDFNTHHDLWESGARKSDGAPELVEWLEQEQLILTSLPNTATHKAGHTIDLVFTNILGVTTTVEEHLHTTSDHETIITRIPLGPNRASPNGKLRITEEGLSKLTQAVAETLPPFIATKRNDLDGAALSLSQCIQLNMARVFRPRNTRNLGAPWWTNACRDAVQAYRQARRHGLATYEKHQLQAEVKHAKRQHWQNAVNRASTSKDIFKITSWRKQSGPLRSPPLRSTRKHT